MPDHFPPVAGVRFRNAGKIFYFHSAGIHLEPGEYVIVETVRGPEIAKVVIAPEQVVVNELGREELKPILRLATDSDIRKMDALRTKAQDLLPEARRMAGEAGFHVHLDSAEFTLDGRRLTFIFASEDRLDYREFVRRASDRFDARVEMRQVGARDRAKLAGGYGVCGRELCCSGWLTTFPSISIRMAKEQDLSLNPQKISGLCGRLLCCLSYEEEGYREMRKTLPKLGHRVSTPTGEGRVIGLNILRRSVTIIVEGQRIEVGDRDLGTVVRWDTASKAGNPPPSMSRTEAIEQGLIEATDDDLEPQPDAEVDWITGRALVTESPGGGRGRLPGGGPRKQGGPPRPRPGQDAATTQVPSPRGRDRGPAPDRGGAPRGARPPRPPQGSPTPDAPSRQFRRSTEPRPEPPSAPEALAPQPPPGSAEAGGEDAPHRRRRRRGRGGGGPKTDE